MVYVLNLICASMPLSSLSSPFPLSLSSFVTWFVFVFSLSTHLDRLIVTISFLLLVVRHLLLEVMHLFLVAY